MKRFFGNRVSVFRRRHCHPRNRSISHLPSSISIQRTFRRTAFSLVEVIIAMGVLTISLVGILAMFPVAFDTARESQYETRVAFIAESLIADLKSTSAAVSTPGPNPGDPPTITREARVLGPDLDALATINLEETADLYFAVDEEGRVSEALTATAWDSGSPGSGFIARVTSIYDTPDHPGLVELQLVVDAPAAAPADARKSYPFVTLLSLP